MPYIFGVDGGGSTSRSILITDTGRVVHIGRGPSVNYHEIGASQAVRVLGRLFQDALDSAHAAARECKAACLGLAGVGRPQDQRILSPLLDNLFTDTPYHLVGDAEIALASGAMADSGILVMAGTGSMAFAKNDEGDTARVGGYGPLISDDGGGYRIAVDGLRAVLRSHDGIDPPTMLKEKLCAHLKLKEVNELVSWVNSDQSTRRNLAELAPLVIRAANEDDASATEILSRHADTLALGVETLHKSLKFKDNAQVVMSGGLLLHNSFYNQMLRRKILYLLPGAAVSPPKMEPIFGSALFAFSLAGIDITEDLLQSIQLTYRDLPKQSTSITAQEETPKEDQTTESTE